ncbi:MAG: UDP-N-acetylmuramate dehydrogenase [Cellulosilyticaceae bacterium]
MEKLNIIHLLQDKIKANHLRENEEMASHTTFKIGGKARYYMTPDSVEELQIMIKACKQAEVPYYIIGNGSNLLVCDDGLNGAVIEIYKLFSDIEIKENYIVAKSGAMLARIAKLAQEVALTGLEFAHGIPGTLGGAIAMNAGAYGGEMKDVVVDVTVMTSDGEVRVLSNEEMEFGYRTSIVTKKGYIVLGATLNLQEGDKETIARQMKQLIEQRREKQPLEYASAGSTFKRPEGYFAGKLIMDSGLRGYQIGGARVSDKHCGFIVNMGGATCKDMISLIEHVQKEVKLKQGIMLETEVKILKM